VILYYNSAIFINLLLHFIDIFLDHSTRHLLSVERLDKLWDNVQKWHFIIYFIKCFIL